MSTTDTPPRSVRVWDPWVRLSHWLLAGAFLLAYLVVEEPLAVHVWAGYLVGALVLIRIAWGFIGPRYARFAQFVPSPRGLLAYAADMVRGRERRHLGHNPAGAVMVLALLLALTGTVATGLMVYGAEEKAGPLGSWYAGTASPAVSPIAEARADADERDDEHGEADDAGEAHEEAEVLEELHEFFANATLFLVIVHVAGVAFTSLRQRENLVRAMVTGRKRAATDERA